MDPISLISGGLGVLGGLTSGIFGMINARKAEKQAEEQRRQRDNYNDAMFRRQYYQDALSRSDTQYMLRRLRNDMRNNVKAQNNTAAITGLTPEAVAATKAANADAYANAVAGIAANNEQRKDAALAQQQALRNHSYADWAQNNKAYAQNWANFASQAFRAGAGAINTLAGAIAPATKPTPDNTFTPTQHSDLIDTPTQQPVNPITSAYDNLNNLT